jgi:hypothetical protein
LLECVETEATVGAEDDQLTVEDHPVGDLADRRGDDVGKPVGDVVAVAGPQPSHLPAADDRDPAS